MLETVRLDSPARLEDTDFAQMRVFRCNAAEIIPHNRNDAVRLGIRKLWKSTTEVEPGALGYAKRRTDMARKNSTDRRCQIERQQTERAKKDSRSPGLQPISEPEWPLTFNGADRLLCILGLGPRARQDG